MLKVWGKIITKNKIICSHTAEYASNDLTEKEMVDICMDEICETFDIQKPLWFSVHKSDLIKYRKVKFNPDSFMEEVDFDRFEIDLIEEEKNKKR